MPITTQDLTKGLDLTGLSSITGSQMNQLVDVARAASDKGFIVETTDSALNTPIVPNPATSYSGITPTWWKRYLWRRINFDASTEIRLYIWDDNAVSDATLLKWLQVDRKGITALTTANTAITNAAAAQATANTALANAAIADSKANDAQVDADAAIASALATAASLILTNDAIAAMWSAGDLKYTCKATVYSIVENQGWVECDGSLLNRLVFSALFASIGTTWGAGDGVLTFGTPDFRGRALLGKGTGAGLTARNLGLTNGGVEEVTLTAAQSGLPAHTHGLTTLGRGQAEDNSNSVDNIMVSKTVGSAGTLANITDSVASAAASQAHTNMPPFGVARIVMKC